MWQLCGAEAARIAPVLHDASTFVGLRNARRLLLFEETLLAA